MLTSTSIYCGVLLKIIWEEIFFQFALIHLLSISCQLFPRKDIDRVSKWKDRIVTGESKSYFFFEDYWKA